MASTPSARPQHSPGRTMSTSQHRISNNLAHYVWRMGDYEAAIEYGQRALVHTTASGDIVEQARAQGLL